MEENIFFRALELSDAMFINALRNLNDFENKIVGNKRFVSLTREQKWIEDLIHSDYQDKFYVAICEKKSEKIIGYTSVSNIDHVNKSCIWGGIKISPDYNQKGYGYQSIVALLKFVFEELNMERFSGYCLEENIAAKNLMLKAGFKIEGVLRNSMFKNGKYHNQYLFSILKKEYCENLS